MNDVETKRSLYECPRVVRWEWLAIKTPHSKRTSRKPALEILGSSSVCVEKILLPNSLESLARSLKGLFNNFSDFTNEFVHFFKKPARKLASELDGFKRKKNLRLTLIPTCQVHLRHVELCVGGNRGVIAECLTVVVVFQFHEDLWRRTSRKMISN